MNRLDFRTWYDQLRKPAWTPVPGTIGLIWQILYPIILFSFGFILYKAMRGGLPWLVAVPFIINLAANLLFMPIFGGLRNLPLATVDIVLVLGTILWMMVAVWPHYRWIAAAQLPYLVWVSIATVLQITITLSNGRKCP